MATTITEYIFEGQAWPSNTPVVVGERCYNDSPSRVYECTSPGTTAGSGGPTGTGSSIGDGGATWKYLAPRDYSSAASWESNTDNDLTVADEVRIGVCIAHFAGGYQNDPGNNKWGQFTIQSGSNYQDATRYRELRPWGLDDWNAAYTVYSGDSHQGRQYHGVVFNWIEFHTESYFRLIGLAAQWPTGWCIGVANFSVQVANCLWDRCMAYDSGPNNTHEAFSGRPSSPANTTGLYVRACFGKNSGSYGIGGAASNGIKFDMDHCTFDQCGNSSFRDNIRVVTPSGETCVHRNNASMRAGGSDVDFRYNGPGTTNTQRNASSDTTGDVGYQNLTPANEWADPDNATKANQDYVPKDSAATIYMAGVAAGVTRDIAGRPFHATTPSIGAYAHPDEYAPSGVELDGVPADAFFEATTGTLTVPVGLAGAPADADFETTAGSITLPVLLEGAPADAFFDAQAGALTIPVNLAGAPADALFEATAGRLGAVVDLQGVPADSFYEAQPGGLTIPVGLQGEPADAFYDAVAGTLTIPVSLAGAPADAFFEALTGQILIGDIVPSDKGPVFVLRLEEVPQVTYRPVEARVGYRVPEEVA